MCVPKLKILYNIILCMYIIYRDIYIILNYIYIHIKIPFKNKHIYNIILWVPGWPQLPHFRVVVPVCVAARFLLGPAAVPLLLLLLYPDPYKER